MCTRNKNNLRVFIFSKFFADNVNLDFIKIYFRYNAQISKLFSTNLRQSMSRVDFENLITNLKNLFSWVSLAYWFSTIFFIFICLFHDVRFLLANCNLFQLSNRFLPISAYLLILSARFYLFTSHFCYLLIIYHLFILVHESFYSFLLFYGRLHQFY